MPPVRRALATSLVALATVASGLAATPASAAVSNSYVALGDSYSAGVGAGSYLSDGTDCMRSLRTFGGLIASGYGLNLNLQACSGAVTADVLNRQVGALNASTGYVTITIGGNDIGFAPVVTECAKPGWLSNCDAAIDKALAVANNELPARLDSVYRAIRSRAPRARVTVAGYPRLFNGQDCHVATFFTAAEMSRLNAAGDRLNAVTSSAATRAGFSYADVKGTFAGHAVCDRPEWIHNVSVLSLSESYHPKADGYRLGYTPPVAARLGLSSPLSSTSSVTTGGRTSSDTTRGQVQTPDLTTPQARKAAARAGVTSAELESLISAQRSGASNATLEALSEAAAG